MRQESRERCRSGFTISVPSTFVFGTSVPQPDGGVWAGSVGVGKPGSRSGPEIADMIPAMSRWIFRWVLAALLAGGVKAPAMSQERAPASAETLVEALLAAMGGREAWSTVAFVHVEAVHDDLDIAEPFVNRIWNDLSEPGFASLRRMGASNARDGSRRRRRTGNRDRPDPSH